MLFDYHNTYSHVLYPGYRPTRGATAPQAEGGHHLAKVAQGARYDELLELPFSFDSFDGMRGWFSPSSRRVRTRRSLVIHEAPTGETRVVACQLALFSAER